MVESSELKRKIPFGWKVGNLFESELNELISPGVDFFDRKNYLATKNIINTDYFDGDWVTFDNREGRANMQPNVNTVWFAKMKNSVKHLVLTEKDEWFINRYILSTGFCGIKCSKNSLPYLFALVESPTFEYVKDQFAHGATQEAVNVNDLSGIMFPIPPKYVLEAFSEAVNPLIEKMNRLLRENHDLAEMREQLAPMLLNGQVSLKNTNN